jgi:DNA-binding Xre family transcriptional regulator
MVQWNVQKIGKPLRWNAKKLAEATGLAYNTVWGIWTNHTRRADLDTLAALAKALEVEPGELIGWAEESKQEGSRR